MFGQTCSFLHVSGELSRRLLHFGKLVTLRASPHNPGAREVAEALGASMGNQLLVTDGTAHTGSTHFLLYLNAETFAGEDGRLLAEELRQCAVWKRKADTPELYNEARIPVVMVHENDPERGGGTARWKGRPFSLSTVHLEAVWRCRALQLLPGWAQGRSSSSHAVAGIGNPETGAAPSNPLSCTYRPRRAV